jgi:hypothetical protein
VLTRIGGAFGRRRRWAWLALAVLVAMLALVRVSLTQPRVHVRWQQTVGPAARAVLERRYGLTNGLPIDGTTGWRYELKDRSPENIGALVRDPAVEDTAYIDRDALTAEGPALQLSVRDLSFVGGDDDERAALNPLPLLLQVHQSLWLFAAGGILLWAARAPGARRRRNVTVGALVLVGMCAWALPISPILVRMGDARENGGDRGRFSMYAAIDRVRFEAHLSYVILGQLDRAYGRTEQAPRQAQVALARATTVWFVLCALAVGLLEGWSPFVLRYLGLALLAPSALLYFGWLETGYHSLNIAAFPLLARGLRAGSWRLEAGSALTGLGAALHGFGLVSLFGAWLAALAARVRVADRIGYLLRIAAWGTAAYLGWTAIDIIILKLPIVTGNADALPWRHLFTDEIRFDRVNAAIVSAVGARDLFMTAWVVGAPLLVVAASLWRQHRDEVLPALAYSLPSLFFTVVIWPTQGLGAGMHLVFARFAAVYALAWVCAHDPRRTYIAAALLASAHYAFWRICLDPAFQNATIR